MLRRNLLVSVLSFITVCASSECPDNNKIYSQLAKISGLPDNRQIIKELRGLMSIRQRCGLNNDSTYAKILHILGRTLWYEQELDSAIAVTRRSIKINSGNSPSVDPANLCHSYYNLASIYQQTGDLANALTELDKAINFGLRYAEKIATVSNSYCLKASIYTSVGDYEKTILASDLAYRYAEKAKRYDLMAKSLIEKAQAEIELNNLQKSEAILEDAVKFSDKCADPALTGSVYSLLAELKRKQNKSSEVVRCYLKAFENYKTAQYHYGCGQAAADLGFYYARYGSNPSKALIYYLIALKYTDNDVTRAILHNHIGAIHRQQQHFDLAISYAQKALTIAHLAADKTPIEQNPSALTIRPVLDKAAVLSLIQNKADTWLAFAKANGNNKVKLQYALKTYMLADTMVDYMRWEHTGSISKLFWRDKTRSIYEFAMETCYLLNDPAKAFYFFEKSRAVMLNDQLNELGAHQLLSPADKDQEALLKKQIGDLQAGIEKNSGKEANLTMRGKLSGALHEQEVFIKMLEQRSPQYYAYKYDNKVLSINELRSRVLAERQYFLSFFIGDSAAYGLCVSQGAVTFKRINTREYGKTVKEFQTLLASKEAQNRSFDRYLQVSSQFYKLMILPFNIPLGTRVIVSPDGNFLPFGALSKSPVSPDYLVKDYAFSYTYSAGYIDKNNRAGNSIFSFGTFLGMAPIEFKANPSLASLPGSDVALNGFARNFLNSKSLIRSEASRNAFVSKSPEYRIVQLLTHATADSTGTVPTLYFADSTLRLTDLSATDNSQTQLLVLSACQTGVGKNQKGEGVFSLARGFAAAGIPSTLTTLWSVENRSIYDLTERFYKGLTEGLTLDVALQQAQTEWLKKSSKSDHLPYSWAGVVLIGNSEKIDTGISRFTLYVSGLLGLIALSVMSYAISSKRKQMPRTNNRL